MSKRNINKEIYIETYGCQMNFADSEIVASIMKDNGYETTNNIYSADAVFLNTCSIRDNAEQKILNRLKQLQSLRKNNRNLTVGVLGCMAERVKKSFLEENELGMRIDMVVGPDAYRDLPYLLKKVEGGQKAINVILSTDETYADIAPVRYASNGVSAFISIMRGCENFCSYCVVPYTRGKERSRDQATIIKEAEQLYNQGYQEITLLGQNVNSYNHKDNLNNKQIKFPELIKRIAEALPLARIRFATSHPKDLSNELIETIASHPNICRSIHLPVQSGSNKVLKRMNRKYTVESYIDKIKAIKNRIPGCSVTTDVISGFCGETENNHSDTLRLMEMAKFDFAFMFKYSERSGTNAAKIFEDDVAEKEKTRRLEEVISMQQKLSKQSNEKDLGEIFEVLVEGASKRSAEHVMGRNSQNKVVIFKNDKCYKPGDFVKVKINKCTSATLFGKAID